MTENVSEENDFALTERSGDTSLEFFKRSGTTDKGKDYENYMVANLALKFVLDKEIKNFTISSNDETFGDFDDVVFEVETANGKEKYALQLKHVNSKKGLALNSFTGDKGNYSIKKYFKTFLETRKKVPECNLLLITNAEFDKSKSNSENFPTEFGNIQLTDDNKKTFTVKIRRVPAVHLINTSEERNYCFQFELENEETALADYKSFFEKFFLYTNQANVDQIKMAVAQSFQNSFNCKDVIFDKYEKFISEWSMQEGKKAKLDKRMMEKVFTLLLLTDYIHPFKPGDVNDKIQIFRNAVSQFDISIFCKELCESVQSIWGDFENQVCTIQEIENLKKKYQLDINDKLNLSHEERTKLLWLLEKCPLIITEPPYINEVAKLCRHQNLVVITNNPSKIDCNKFSVFQKLSDLSKYENMYGTIAKNFKCKLYADNINLSIEELVDNDKQFLESITTNEMLRMGIESLSIYQSKEELPQPFVERSLSKNHIHWNYLDNFQDDTFVLISNVTRTKIELFKNFNVVVFDENWKQKSGNDKHNNDLTKKTVLYITPNECTLSDFDRFCKENKKIKIFHHFKLDGEYLEWIQSSGSISDLEQYRLEDSSSTREILTQNKLNIITGDPGIGKSTLLKSLKNRLKKKYFTVILTPRDIFALSELKKTDFEEFILNSKVPQIKGFEKEVVEFLMRKGQVAYLWDAFDEVPDNQDKIIEMIIKLAEKVEVQYITSRRHLKKYLENKLNVISRTILSLNNEQQENYIHHRLKPYLKEKTKNVTNAILRNISSISHINILENPLQIHMLTELFRQDPKKYEKLFEEMFSLTDLYYHFIEETFNKHKGKIEISGDAYSLQRVQQLFENTKKDKIKMYQEAAVKYLFEKKFVDDLDIKCESFCVEIKQNGDDLGFITEIVENQPQFSHKLYAEYFAASYLASNFQHIPSLQDVIFDQKYTTVRSFFDMLVAKNSPAHKAVLYKNVNYLDKCNDFKSKDLLGRNLLQLACSWGERHPLLPVKKVKDLFKTTYIIDDSITYTIKKDTIEYIEMLKYLLKKCDPTEKDTFFKLDSLTIAEKCECLTAMFVVEQNIRKNPKFYCNLLYYAIKYEYDFIIDIFNKFKYVAIGKDSSLLHLAVESKRVEYVEKCLLTKEYRNNVRSEDQQGRTLLHLAVSNNNDKIAELLIKNGAKINATDKNGWTPLFLSSFHGHVESMKCLLQYKANANIATKDGVTPLYMACKSGLKEPVKVLLENKADIHKSSKSGWTPLHIASQGGNMDITELLIESGAAVNAINNNGSTPLFIASQEGCTDVAKFLIKRGSVVNQSDTIGWTPLHVAAQNGQEDTVALLITAQADVNATTKNGNATALHKAIQEKHVEVAKKLINADADVNIVDRNKSTPLQIACLTGIHEVVESMIRTKADLNVVDANGASLIYLASKNGYEKVVKLLKANGVDVNAVDKHGWSPLHIACQNGHENVAKLLIDNSADVTARTKGSFATPLHKAAQEGHTEIVRLLLDKNAEIDCLDSDGYTPLYLAVKYGHCETVNLLIEKGANANFKDEDNQTLLHVACENGFDETVDLLLGKGLNVNASDKSGWTPLHSASRYINITSSLIRCGADVNLTDYYGLTPLEKAFKERQQGTVDLLYKAGAKKN